MLCTYADESTEPQRLRMYSNPPSTWRYSSGAVPLNGASDTACPSGPTHLQAASIGELGELGSSSSSAAAAIIIIISSSSPE